ncbi:UNVERIFIED_CONTAM: 3-hydroxyisobutyryl-CoA hydrolase-like protein 1, mitochondrial [Sesamum radiatum]|uniref:3-hydroxyisobutyryl-CoA hydrolase n=1 Tax=Sesamum radiatum TaxID=300843 RepID=A0AAW2R070_SESRA
MIMLSNRSALFIQSCLSLKKPSYGYRRLISLSANPLVDDSDNTVDVEGIGSSRTAILSRPSSLNAINIPMVSQLQKLYKSWEDDPDIGFVVLKGRGRAFCAGGDIVSLYNLIKEGNLEECKQLFRKAYSLMYFVGTYLKPHVAILNGITMGGGDGISIPGTFRVATDKTIFATPETLIGLHPDAGASFYLSHLPGYLGEYLGLTGEKLNGAEMISCGLATHYSLFTKLPLVERQLRNLVTGDPSVIETCLESLGDPVRLDPTSVVHRIQTLNKCFSRDTVEEIIESLIREGRFQTLEQCLIREYRMSVRAISGQITGDFCEGVRAKLVDKDFAPKWDPPSLEHVSEDMVDQYFSPLPAFEPELELPMKQRAAFWE